jgi:hypothetical protein
MLEPDQFDEKLAGGGSGPTNLLCRRLTTGRSGPPCMDSLYQTDYANERKNCSDYTSKRVSQRLESLYAQVPRQRIRVSPIKITARFRKRR